MAGTFSVKNFERFQHYKDRNPVWIKLYNELLDDYAFGQLPDASKMHLIAIWLLASRYKNQIPLDPDWVARRINATSPVDLRLLADSGFIIVDKEELASGHTLLAEPYQVASPEREKRQRREEKKELSGGLETRPSVEKDFDDFWKAYPKREGANPKAPAKKLFIAAVKAGTDPQAIITGARRCAEADKDKIGTPYIPQAVKWLRDKRWEDYAAASSRAPPVREDYATAMARLKKQREDEANNGNGNSTANGTGTDHEKKLLGSGEGVHSENRPRVVSG